MKGDKATRSREKRTITACGTRERGALGKPTSPGTLSSGLTGWKTPSYSSEELWGATKT